MGLGNVYEEFCKQMFDQHKKDNPKIQGLIDIRKMANGTNEASLQIYENQLDNTIDDVIIKNQNKIKICKTNDLSDSNKYTIKHHNRCEKCLNFKKQCQKKENIIRDISERENWDIVIARRYEKEIVVTFNDKLVLFNNKIRNVLEYMIGLNNTMAIRANFLSKDHNNNLRLRRNCCLIPLEKLPLNSNVINPNKVVRKLLEQEMKRDYFNGYVQTKVLNI